MIKQGEQSYSRVIFKRQKAKNFVNSYRFRSQSPRTFKIWNQELDKVERFKKKRQREDGYIHGFSEKDRPILLIKNKEAFLANKKPLITHQDEQFFKVSQNTVELQNVPKEITDQEKFIRKQTIMNSISKFPNKDHAVYKIEGLEFLPEGFLELDPLLYKDEYTFESKIQEDMFNKKQRRVKALRRKQYQQKKKKKMRDVIIFVADEKREKVIDFLEKWYFKNKRRMNDQEIEYCANLLECNKEHMKKLQEAYLNQMKKQNTEDLKVYLHQKGQLDEEKVTLPISLAKYFVKGKNPYRGVSPRVYEEKTIYNPFGKNYWQGKVRNCKSQNLLPKKNREHFVDRIFKNLDKEKTNQKKIRSSQVQTQQLYQNKNKKKINNNLEEHFNNKIDMILDNIQTNDQEDLKKVSFKKKNSNKSLNNSMTKTIKKQSIKQSIKQKKSKSPKKSILRKSIKTKRQTTPNKNQQKPQFKHFQSVLKDNNNETNKKKLSFIKTAKRISIVAKTKEGNTIILQKLQPIQIGTQTFYQQIRDEQTPNGRKVSLITQDNQGRIINKKDLNIQQIGNFYNNYKYKNIQNPQIVTIEVQNDLGQIIDIQEVFQKNAIINNQNDKKRLTLQNLNQNQIIRKKNKTIHILQPVNIAGQFYNQAVEQIINGNKKQFRVITTNQDGTILEDKIIKKNLGEQFYNEVVEGLINDKGIRKITLNLKNQNGDIVDQQIITIKQDDRENNSEILDRSFRKSSVMYQKNQGRNFRIYSTPPIIVGKTFLTQQIKEEVNSLKQSNITVFTFDEKGAEISQDIVDARFKTENYSVEPLKNMRGITIVTKNDNGDIINVREISQSQCDFIQEDEIQNKFKDRKSIIVDKQVKNKSIIRTHSLRPSVFANQYYKQIVEEVVENKNKKYTIKTFDKNEELVSSISINKNDFEGDEFYTEMIGNENGQSISIITRNEENQILLAQELEKRLEYLFNQQSLQDFDRKSNKKNSLISKQESINRNVISYTIRPAKVNDFAFQQIIKDIIDKEGNKERLMLTYNDQGDILAADIQDNQEEIQGDLEQQFKIEDIDENKKKITIVVNDESGKEIGIQEITIDNQQDQNLPRKSTIKVKDTLIVRNNLGLTQVGNKYYNSVVNEVIKDNQIQYLEVELQDENNQTIAKKQVPNNLAGNYYDSIIQQIFIDSEGFQRPSIQILNDREQVLASFQDRVPIKVENKQSILFNDEPIVQYLQNDIKTQNKKNSTIVLKKLRPTYYQGRSYEFCFEEVIDQNGNRRLTLITKKDDQEISRDKVDQKIANEEHENYIANLIQQRDRKVTLEFRNNNGRLILRKTLDVSIENRQEPFDDFQEKFNEYGQRESQIFIKKNDNKITKNHLLSPTLMGTEYYQQIVNEIIDKDNKSKDTMVITIDEQGKKISQSSVPSKLTGKSYHTEVEESINDNGIRNFSLITKNDKGTVVSRKTLKPGNNLQQNEELQNEIIEEIVDFKDNKKINLIEDQNEQQFVLNQSFANSNKDINVKQPINNKDNNQYFEELLKEYSFTNDANRYSLNRQKQNNMRNTMHVNDINRKKRKTQDNIKIQQNQIQSIKDMPEDMKEIYDKFNKLEKDGIDEVNSNFDSIKNYQKDYINSINNARDKKNDTSQELDKAVSLLLNKEKEKIMTEIIKDLENKKKNNNTQQNDENLLEEFQKFCKEVLPQDKEYKESIMLVSLFYYFLKKKQLKISQLILQL